MSACIAALRKSAFPCFFAIYASSCANRACKSSAGVTGERSGTFLLKWKAGPGSIGGGCKSRLSRYCWRTPTLTPQRTCSINRHSTYGASQDVFVLGLVGQPVAAQPAPTRKKKRAAQRRAVKERDSPAVSCQIFFPYFTDVKECDVEHHVYLDSDAGPLGSNGYCPSGTPLDGLEAIEESGFIYSCTSQNVSTDQGI